MRSDLVHTPRAERIAELQALVDEAEGRQPVPRGVPHLVVGSWLALVAHYLQNGGVAAGSPDVVLLGLLAAGGWGFLLFGGTRFAAARIKLRRLRKELLDLIEGPSDFEESTDVSACDPT
jgi:hypothetical protein